MCVCVALVIVFALVGLIISAAGERGRSSYREVNSLWNQIMSVSTSTLFATLEKRYKLPYTSFRHREKVTSRSVRGSLTSSVLGVVHGFGGLHHPQLYKRTSSVNRDAPINVRRGLRSIHRLIVALRSLTDSPGIIRPWSRCTQ